MSRLKCGHSVQAGQCCFNVGPASQTVIQHSVKREISHHVFTGPSECVSISQTNIHFYESTKAQYGLLIDDI